MLALKNPNLFSSHVVCLVNKEELKQFVDREVKTLPSFSNKHKLWFYSVVIFNSLKK